MGVFNIGLGCTWVVRMCLGCTCVLFVTLSCLLRFYGGLGSLGQTFHLELLSCLEKLWELILCHIHLSSIHKLQDSYQMLEWNVLENDDGMFGWILFKKGLEIWRACGQDHFVGLSALTVTSNGNICKRLLISEVFKAGNHVGLEIVPSQTKLLLVIHFY